ncbi:host specificity factor TipJ family phage tail protein [Selenomonas noxia]|uniref:host specificity factor TipJ family phage tail protein n=1 Tax=Selenomonas noxia TaxID=135083 RepID=UPI0028805373|nr:host specificity factor TipJ family phage tail protein [Selenomonas noxia]
MIQLVIVRNPFDVTKREMQKVVCRDGMPLSSYFCEPGRWQYSINGILCDPDAVPADGDCVVIVPYVEGKVFGMILSVGLSFLTAGIAGGAILGGLSMGWRMVTAIAIGMIGGALVSRLNRPRVDTSNADQSQSQTYGWGGTSTLTGQGHPLAITYGAMKSGGVLLSRHIVSDGARQYLHLLYCAGEGELQDIRNIRINENPADNYKDVQIDIRLGTNDQTIIPNFADNYADQPLNYELSGAWATHEVQGNLCTGIELTVALPNGLYYSNDEGGMDLTSVTLAAECHIVGSAEAWTALPLCDSTGTDAFLTRKDGAWVRSLNGASLGGNYSGRINEATNRAIYRVYRFEGLPPGRYEVRVRCVHKDGNTVRYVNRVYWTQLTQIVYDDFVHPGKALIGIRALATEQLSGNDPAVTWVQERSKLYVWNPYRKAYEEKRADNPAWACYDILHQCRRIGGRYIVRGEPADRLSYDMFKAWAEQCDSKGYAFNYIYDSAMQVWEALRYPETVGRGKVIMQGTRFTCVYDYPAQPSQLFTVGNIKQDSFKEEFQGTQGRANVIEISFMNKDKNFERDVLPVFSDDYDASEALSTPTQIELMGCTDLKQAYAHGKHALRANKYELRTCTFDAYVDAIACTIGDVILLQHDVTEWGSGGRVVSVDGAAVTLDRTVTMAEGKQYRLMVRDSKTDTLHTYEVQSVSGAVVTLAQAAEIAADDLYTFGEATKEAKPFRVLSITKGMTEQTRKITCMEYYPELYADDNTDVPIIDYTTQSDKLTVNNLLVIVEIKTLPDGTTLYDLAVSWRLPRSAVAKQIKVEYRRDGETEYTTQGVYDGNATSSVITGVAAAVSYTVRVTCYNDLGLAGNAAMQTVYTAPKDAPPSKVQDFSALQDAGNSSVLQLAWKANPETDILGYRLFDGAGSVLVDLIGGTSYSYFIPTSGTYVFGLRAVNRSGVVSAETADVSITATVAAGSVAVPDAPHSGEVRLQGGTVTAVWEAVTNTYIDYYEVRTNSNTGQLAGLLAKTADIRSTVSLTARSGAVLVYGHNPKKGYGEPLSIHYDFPAPAAPTIRITNTLQGFNVSVQDKPENVSGTRVHISGGGINETLETTGTFVSYVGAAGVYTVQAACFDSFGDGTLSPVQEVIVKAKIDKNDIENLTIAEKDLDAALAERMRDVQTTKESVSSIVAKLSGNPQESGYSAITQIYNGLQLKVNQGDVVTAINVAPTGVKIDGRLLHITGNTIIDGNVIANHMLQAGAITADKLVVDSLSAISAKIGKLRTKDTGARTEISDNLIEVFDEGEKTRVRIGIFE